MTAAEGDGGFVRLILFQVFFNESFRYVREVVGSRDAVLEFQVELDGLVVNGVDMIRWEDGRGGERLTARTWGCHGSQVDDQSFPVTVLVKRSDGSSEEVRVGTAVRAGDGFRLTLGELSIGATADPVRARGAAPSSGGEGMVFPPYGRSKGAPIAGASIQDLEFYISGSRRSLDDPSKARWHDKERVLLAAMEAELARRTGATGGGAGGGYGGQSDFDDAPPHSDDDIPF